MMLCVNTWAVTPHAAVTRSSTGCLLLIMLTVWDRLGSAMGSAMGSVLERLPRDTCLSLDLPECEGVLEYPHGMQEQKDLLTDRQATIRAYHELQLQTKCSNDLVYLMCASYAPPCVDPAHEQGALQPCRGLCRDVSTDCEKQVVGLNISWPKQLACGRLPTRHIAQCLSPEHKHHTKKTKGELLKTPLNAPKDTNAVPGCKCRKSSSKLSRTVYQDRQFSFAVRAVFITKQDIKAGGPIIVTIYVQEVLKTASVRIPANTNLTLWAARGCVCPSLKENHHYLFLGYEDRSHSRLLFDDFCIAVRWSDKWKDRITKWEMRRRRAGRQNNVINVLQRPPSPPDDSQGEEDTQIKQQRHQHRDKPDKKKRVKTPSKSEKSTPGRTETEEPRGKQGRQMSKKLRAKAQRPNKSPSVKKIAHQRSKPSSHRRIPERRKARKGRLPESSLKPLQTDNR